MKKTIFSYLLGITLLFMFSNCSDDDDNQMVDEPVTENIVELAIANGFNSLAEALTKAGLVDDLQGTGPFTVFAPTDAAFANMLAAIGQASIDDVPASVLEQVLLYHVVSGDVFSADVSDGDVTTLEGTAITLNTAGGITVNGANVINPFDVEASNGVIHTIDEVLIPASVAQFVNTVLEPAYFNEDFSDLVSAVVKADLVETLLTTPNLTIFAPTNDAFDATGIDVDATDAETLVSVLTYHVLGAKVLSSEIPGEAETLNGESIYFTSDGSSVFINSDTEIVAVDIESGSGVVHVIDMVLLPPTDTIVDIAVDVATNDGEFTVLVAALTRSANEGTDLLSVLSGDGPFTVFAPTDAAFVALLDAIGQASLDDIPIDVLEQILSYHVIADSVFSSEISDGEVTTVEGTNVTISTGSGIMVNDATVVEPFNVQGTNGVIHTIDQVLVPDAVLQFVDTVLEPAYFNNSFTTLVSAVVKADLVETLLTTDNLTIFAPTNDAFEAAGIVVNDTDVSTLTTVLTYHVVGAKVLSTEIPREAETLEGNSLFFSLVEAGNFINGNTEITAVDIESGTGVVHVIDMVLLPPSGTIVDVVVALSEGGEYTSLVAALQRTADEGTAEQNLLTVLAGEGPFTVFAPTNAAFQALLDGNDDWDGLGDIPLETLIDVLTYHVVAARAYDKDLAGALDDMDQIETVNGASITVDLDNLTIDSSANITEVNVNATNGTIHVIDAVLVP